MTFWAGYAEDCLWLSGLRGPPDRVFGERQMSWPGPKDVRPGLSAGERDLVWCYAYGGPMLPVKLFDVVHNRTRKERSDVGEA